MTMTPIHPLWFNFNERLWDAYNQCDASLHCPTARQVLQEMALTGAEISRAIGLFNSMGVFCDCELLLNMDTLRPSMAGTKR